MFGSQDILLKNCLLYTTAFDELWVDYSILFTYWIWLVLFFFQNFLVVGGCFFFRPRKIILLNHLCISHDHIYIYMGGRERFTIILTLLFIGISLNTFERTLLIFFLKKNTINVI